MDNMIEVKYKHVPFNCKFKHKDIEYEKTSFNRGFYHNGSKVIFRNFKKSTKVLTSDKFFDQLPLTNP